MKNTYKTVSPAYHSMEEKLQRYKMPIKVAFHLAATILSLAMAFFMRFDFTIPHRYFLLFLKALPFLIVARMGSYYYYKCFSASWRFAYLKDLMVSLKAVILGSVIFIIAMVFVVGLEDFPRSVFFLEIIFNLAFITGTKLIVRYVNETRPSAPAKIKKDILIVGAGKAGVLMLNELRYNRHLGINAVGFIDDDPYKQDVDIQGVHVLGRTEDIPRIAGQYKIDEVVLALPSSGRKTIMRITRICEEAGLKTQVIPSIGKLLQEGSLSTHIKEISYEALLGRSAIKFSRESDRRLMEEEINGKAVLVTGAGGSIGSELCRQIAGFSPRIIVMYDRYENSLYYIERELTKDASDVKILPVIGDILDDKKLARIFKEHGIDIIYHAAAYKHVPMMEREPVEAAKNNVLGTMNVARIAMKYKSEKFILISTDKAVKPANIMGTTKRIAEIVTQGFNGKGTRFIAVRFGNVIGSNGSVIPIFKKQIQEGGPITVTHEDITRYFMSIPEAVQLVMTAGAMGKGSEIFLLDMGEPVKIADLARELIRLSGLEPGKDIDIVFSGLRPGEKMYEELYWQGEGIVPTGNKKITMLKHEEMSHDAIMEKVETLKKCVKRNNFAELTVVLKDLVPEATIDADR